jgi:molybdopterin molybdotransferase
VIYDKIIAVDWSARSKPSPNKPTKDAIFICVSGGVPTYYRTRHDAMAAITAHLDEAIAQGERVLLGFDFSFGYPDGFAKALTGSDSAESVWKWLAGKVKDAPDNVNNRFDVAKEINAMFGGVGPFWGCPENVADNILPSKGTHRRDHGQRERRHVELAVSSAQSTWKLFTTGSVGSQALMGLPCLWGLKERFGDDLTVWPHDCGFSQPDANITVVEIYPSLHPVDHLDATYQIEDAKQVRAVCDAFELAQTHGTLFKAFTVNADHRDADVIAQEGWILGVGINELKPPVLTNDCFALPQGVHWTPVDTALAELAGRLHPVAMTETISVTSALGRIVAQDVIAKRSNPPTANSAVDGYGFDSDSVDEGAQVLPLVDGRAAAGDAFNGVVPAGKAVRILTGAMVPQGVNTVVLEEDCTVSDTAVAFNGTLTRGANTRQAGEDIENGTKVVAKGTKLSAGDIAILAATGVSTLSVFKQLRVAILSTGDELTDVGDEAVEGQIFDANRPMLGAMFEKFGATVVDVGKVPDDPTALRAAFDRAAKSADMIITSGGASAGDEDHVSRLLQDNGSMALWRVAMKPGRPLALGVWNETPVFGLPGNPVAAFVCALIFAKPAFDALAGSGFSTPQAFYVPAGFAKSKKAGRREYLRARIGTDGRTERFVSEGSGRISGLAWADGLIELPDGAMTIKEGDLVKYLPISSFGL